MPNPAAIPVTQDALPEEYAKKTLALLSQHGIPPIPENYAVWFCYAMGKNKELAHEVETALANGLSFTPETSLYLYNKYVLASRNQKAVDDAAAGAHRVLIEVL